MSDRDSMYETAQRPGVKKKREMVKVLAHNYMKWLFLNINFDIMHKAYRPYMPSQKILTGTG